MPVKRACESMAGATGEGTAVEALVAASPRARDFLPLPRVPEPLRAVASAPVVGVVRVSLATAWFISLLLPPRRFCRLAAWTGSAIALDPFFRPDPGHASHR